MEKKEIINREEPVSENPHKSPKAKVVFDPSNNIVPKKKNKKSHADAKETVKKTTVKRKRKRTKKSNSVPVNPVSKKTELLDCLSTENDTISINNSPLTQKTTETCYLCSKVSEMTELVDCPICCIKVHTQCLIVNEPIWICKLYLNHWLCTKCRKESCNKCLKDESQSEIAYRCLNCDNGFHKNCYEPYDNKPMYKIEEKGYLCIPCVDLATKLNPGEEDNDDNKDDDNEPKPGSSGSVCVSSDGDDRDSKLGNSFNDNEGTFSLITMEKKEIINREEPVSENPHKSPKAKVVFDPSNNIVPKKKNKKSHADAKETVKKTTVKRKRKRTKKSNSVPVNPVSKKTELLDCLSTENDTISINNSPLTQKTTETCYLCSKVSEMTELVDCPICCIKVHTQCLIVNEPIWICKLYLNHWLCTKCRKESCNKCLKDEFQSEIAYRCLNCDNGFHKNCYEPYDNKPMYKIEEKGYLCIPCVDLATKLNPGEEDNDDNKDDDNEPKPGSSGSVCVSSDGDDRDSKLGNSFNDNEGTFSLITMEKKEIINREEPVSENPHKSPKAKVVFDPSNNIVPKKKNKKSHADAKETVKKTTVKRKRKRTKKSNSVPVNPVSKKTELLDCLSTENDTISINNSPLTQKTTETCYLCSKVSEMTELVDCPICCIKVHTQCLIVNEPIWICKLYLNHWLCTKCRKESCNKCLKDESQSEIAYRCLNCDNGFHKNCYEPYDNKPMYKIEEKGYLCIPCVDLATKLNPGEEDNDDNKDDDNEPKPGSSGSVCVSSDGDDRDSKLGNSFNDNEGTFSLITMEKKEIINREEPVSENPHKSPKAKVVFDPSNNIVPKKKNKKSHADAKETVKKTTVKRKRKRTKKSNSVPVNPVSKKTELLDCLSTENDTISINNSPLTQKTTETCYLCSKVSEMTELVDCPICCIKVHTQCLIVNEPIWICKLYLNHWLCTKCRKESCNKCLKDEFQSEIAYRCLNCDNGFHKNCYEPYDNKPMYKIEEKGYLCIPCVDLATKLNPGEEDNDDNKDDDNEPKPGSSGSVCVSSDGDDRDSKLGNSFNDNEGTFSLITMEKKEIINREEPVSENPHKSPKAKVVFDPSNNIVPKKKNKKSHADAKETVKKTTVKRKRKRTKKSNSVPVNPVSKKTELLDCLSTENDTISINNSPLTQKTTETCYLCSKVSEMTELVDCPICCIKVHTQCLIVNEPIWICKLYLNHWLCTKCRKESCNKCLKDESQSEIAYRCLNCDNGFHKNCYEPYDNKPMYKIEEKGYLCIPCVDLATKLNPGEEDNDDNKDDDNEPKPGSSGSVCVSSDGDDRDSKLGNSFNDNEGTFSLITMEKKEIINREEPVSENPHKSPKAKVVFDPSNNIVPKKKNKKSHADAKETVKKTTVKRKRKRTKKSNSVPVNPVSKKTELLDCLSTENDTISINNSPLTQKTTETCYLCSKVSEMTELVDCPICCIKVHTQCLIVNEPIWICKLYLNHWLCTKCRKESCNKCLKDESQSEIAYRCLNCDNGFHKNCYEPYDNKPMYKIEEKGYLCIPCVDLATKLNPGEEDNDDNKDDDNEPKPGSSGSVCVSSDGDDRDSKLGNSFNDNEDEDEPKPGTSGTVYAPKMP